jgi:hypothetical protein
MAIERIAPRTSDPNVASRQRWDRCARGGMAFDIDQLGDPDAALWPAELGDRTPVGAVRRELKITMSAVRSVPWHQ